MVSMSYFCRQNVSQISLEIVANCSHPSEILALLTFPRRGIYIINLIIVINSIRLSNVIKKVGYKLNINARFKT